MGYALYHRAGGASQANGPRRIRPLSRFGTVAGRLPCLAAAIVALVVAGTAVAGATQRTAIHTVAAHRHGRPSRWSPET